MNNDSIFVADNDKRGINYAAEDNIRSDLNEANSKKDSNKSVAGVSPEDKDAEFERLKAELGGTLSEILKKREVQLGKAAPENDDSNICCVQYGLATKAIKSFRDLMSFTLKNDADIFDVRVNSDTEIQLSSCLKGQEVYIIGVSYRFSYVAKMICTGSFYRMFDATDNIIDKLLLMKKFLKLSCEQQDNIALQMRGKRYGVGSCSDVVRFKDIDELRLKYSICRDTYTHQQQRDIDNLFSECRGIGKAGKSIIKLMYILNISSVAPVTQTPTKESIMEALNKSIYKLDKVKTEIVEAIIASKYSQNHGLRLLLIGNPGTGKTTLINAIAEAYNLPCDIIHLNGANSALEIKGTDSSYESSDVGKLTKSFYQLGTTNAVIGLDEIDKMASGGKDGNPADALLDTLSDENSFYDAFLETSRDTHNTKYIATANSTYNIPECLLNRFKIITIDDYEDDDKVAIAQKYIIPQLLEAYSLSDKEIVFSDDVLHYIVKQFCSDSGVRMLKENIHSIIRRIISQWDEAGKRFKTVVSKELVSTRLEPVAEVNNSQLRYHRNKDLCSETVRGEIKKCFARLQGSITEPREKETLLKRLEYMTSIIPAKGGFETFDKDAFFACVNSTHFGMLPVKEKIAKLFYAKALKKKSFSSERILLAGGPGIGKSSICKSIAQGLGVPFIKISLNGVSDIHMIKGFEPSYVGSDAGIIMRELAKAGTTRVLIQLDEIDKLGGEHGVNVSSALLDLLDNSSEFTDEFFGVPFDLSNVLFIATANDLSNTEPWLLDRFSIIQLDGYTYSDKEQILDKYVMHRLNAEYTEAGIKFSISNDAKRSLLRDYCASFGVRDLEKAIEKIANDLLFENGNVRSICIEAKDVVKSLGPKPIPRGNLLKKNVSGFSKALAVSGNNSGMSFSVESVIFPSDNSTCITGLPRESTVDSVKLAKTYIRTHYLSGGEDFGVHLHFGEGAVVKDGPSAGIAIMISMLSAVFDTPVEGNAAYTGEIDLFGNVFSIGGTLAKIQAAEQSGCSKVFIPRDNYEQLSEADIKQSSIEIIPVEHVSEVISTVLPNIRLSSECQRR